MSTQDVLRSMLIHTCTFTKAGRPVASAGSYGHSTIDFTTPDESFTGIQCRFKVLTDRERMTQGTAGQVVADYYLYVIWEELPTELRDPSKMTGYRISSIVATRSGLTIASGPFDINGVEDQAGEQHHWRVLLREVR